MLVTVLGAGDKAVRETKMLLSHCLESFQWYRNESMK